MSIKKLFDSPNRNKNYLSDTDQKKAFADVESSRNVEQLSEKQNTFVPQIDFSEPENFVKYGSAYLYYKAAVERIYDYYPYDGSDAEINKFFNGLLDIEKYIFNNEYPRTNGFAIISADGWGTLNGSIDGGYGLPNTTEYITFFGGPNKSEYTTLASAFPNPKDSKFQHSNIFDTDIYTTAGEPTDFGSGTRQSNLQSNFDNGVTIEFWLKKDGFTTALTEKEVVFDMWNNNASGSSDYGRMRVELTGAASGSPFLITALNGTSGIYQQSIGNNLTTGSLTDFAHYSFAFYNDGSNFVTKLYVNGTLNDTNTVSLNLGELESKNMVGRLGALLTASASPSGPVGQEYAGKLSASVDEFRFWKIRRNSKEIFDKYNTHVRGGTNSDISNTTLGVYFKFNEGITTVSSTDSNVLDYSGRISNGVWTGYGSNSRNTGSAIVLAGAATKEYLDPIIYATHPSVSSLNTTLQSRGDEYDRRNNNAFVNLLPSWILEESEESETNLRTLSHIAGTYLDKLYLQISALNSFKGPNYTSASYTPLPFAQHLPQSLGLYTPEIFIDSEVTERFLNVTADSQMESDLTEAKNLIYLNLYNNIANIYKSKGTERAVKNILRCFNLDDKVVKLKTYSNNQTFEIKNNLKLVLEPETQVNNNSSANLGGVVYQRADSSNADSVGFISGTYESDKEGRYGFTTEVNVTFPSYNFKTDTVDRFFKDVSLFGVHEANTGSADDTTWLSTDSANFQVFAIRDTEKSKNVSFKLTSSISPHPFPELTSSVFLDNYDNQDWNISVRLKPSNYPLTNLVSGSNTYTYVLEFKGQNTVNDVIQNSFTLTSSVSKAVGAEFLKSAKRLYVGARRTNITGALLQKSDVLFSDVKYWTKYIDDTALEQHTYDAKNAGISNIYRNISPLDSNLSQTDVANANTLALHWTYDNITGSDSSGNFFFVTDQSSGSAELRDNYGWIGGIAGSQHTGYGFGYAANSTNVVKKENRNTLRFVDPETSVSSNMVNVLTETERLFDLPKDKPEYYHVIEKSMYDSLSEEMLHFFAGVVDFNNIIGEPVHRYRQEYKSLSKLREAFFRKVTEVSAVEKFIRYYKWFDDSLSQIIAQMIPASDGVIEDSYNVIESHALERNKYRSQFPTLEFKTPEPEALALGINEKLLKWRLGHHPVSGQQNTNSPWWLERAIRTGVAVTSGDATIDSQREEIRKNVNKLSNAAEAPNVKTVGGVSYKASIDVLRRHGRPYKLDKTRDISYGGGVNFTDNKNIQFTYNALAPAGPVARPAGAFIPQNTLVAFTGEATDLKDSVDVVDPNKKTKRYFKLNQGRDYYDGGEYTNVKSSFGLPFNVISGAVGSGHNKHVVEKVNLNIDITNLHNDVYGSTMEIPMQGPFTNYAVGGHQSRHIALNKGSDDYTTRPEAWKILLGSDSIVGGITGAIGMAGADYPWPEANDFGAVPYPMTASQKAVFYRDHVAKRPVNIRNIKHTTGSTVLGNYNRNYDIVQTFGGFSNPRGFVENPPTLPTQVTQTPSASQGRTILSIRRDDEGHFEFTPPYSISYLTSAAGKSVIRTRFSAPGGIETIGQGYGDIRSNDYSVYNTINYRNLTVKRPFQNMSGTTSEAVGVGTPGIRVSDIHGNDYGLAMHLARHSGRFGRDSLLVANPGVSVNESPSFHKVNRNSLNILVDDGTGVVSVGKNNDNFFVQHQIPRADRQYSWITGSLADKALSVSNIRFWGFAPTTGPQTGYYRTGSNYLSYFDFVTASSVLGNSGTASLFQPALGLNIYIEDPIDENSDNILGRSLSVQNTAYLNNDLLEPLGISADLNKNPDAFNLLMTKRKNTFGYRGAPQTGPAINPIIRRQRKQNILSYYHENTLNRETLKPVSYRGTPSLINLDIGGRNVTVKSSYSNDFVKFGSDTLNERFSVKLDNKQNTFKQIIDISKNSNNYKLNWVSYSETLFPSALNEFSTGSSERTSYDNLYWRDSQSDRFTLFNNSVRFNSYGARTKESSWPLDAQEDFLTRANAPVITGAPAKSTALRLFTNTAGELQNVYQQVVKIALPAINTGDRRSIATFGGLYNRKHMLGGARSVSSPSGMPIPETGSYAIPPVFTDVVDVFAGEAVWEAGTQAGIVEKSGSSSTFISKPSEPWFNSYDDYKKDISLVNRGYSIVPEFRLSEHMSDYTKYGIDANNKFDILEIVGTSDNSSQTDFYKDFSNSEFMENFVNISEETGLSASEIKLTCNATIRLNPYKGFYPAQRTIQIMNQFKDSYKDSVIAESSGSLSGSIIIAGAEDGGVRPIAQALFAPGILYNTIKSGIAVDYPVAESGDAFVKQYYGSNTQTDAGVSWMVTANTSSGDSKYTGGQFWSRRIPFEAIIQPEEFISKIKLFDMEPHPSASLEATASFDPKNSDSLYRKISSNFFGEIARFFLKEDQYTRLESDTVTSDLRFESGSVYGARIKIRRSLSGSRVYTSESGSTGDNAPYNTFGAAVLEGGSFTSNTVPLPQDPRQLGSDVLQESFTMYSRPTAFGPAVAGRPGKLLAKSANVTASSPIDSIGGFNWAYTPPYYNGESWLDIVFSPTPGETYDLEKILKESQTKYWRIDPGVSASAAPGGSVTSFTNTQLVPTFSGNVGGVGDLIYEGKNVNDNAMQLDACINPFGVVRVAKEQENQFGNKILSENESVGKKWVIQPKMETPMLNFNNKGVRPITNANGTLSLPTYSSASVPRGMWHQFGVIEPDPNKGIFLEIGEIPKDWLQYHYSVTTDSSIYNRNNPSANGATAFRDIEPLTNVVKFNVNNASKRLGELKESLTIKEAIVAVPYTHVTSILDNNIRRSETKKFFGIDRSKIDQALSTAIGSADGDSLDNSGESIRDLVSKIEEYVFPPQFDFVNNKAIEPMAMYVFEFEYKFDKDDLSYIWQNLAPRDYQKITKQAASTAHILGDNQLLSKEEAVNDSTRWMVFKVKQRSQTNYEDLIPSQAGESTTDLFKPEEEGYKLQYNWPYDYVSFVETIKIGAEVLYRNEEE